MNNALDDSRKNLRDLLSSYYEEDSETTNPALARVMDLNIYDCARGYIRNYKKRWGRHDDFEEFADSSLKVMPLPKPKTTIDVEIKMAADVDKDGRYYYHFDEMDNFVKKLRETHSSCDIHVKVTGVGF